MSRTYSRWDCPVCHRQISANGAARTAHCRQHVREGRMEERREFHRGYPYTSVHFEVVKKALWPKAPGPVRKRPLTFCSVCERPPKTNTAFQIGRCKQHGVIWRWRMIDGFESQLPKRLRAKSSLTPKTSSFK